MGAAESKPQLATLGEQRRKSSATDPSLGQSINQSTNQSVNQPGMISVNSGVTVYDRAPSIKHQSSINQPINHQINHPVNQPINHSIDQPINQPINQSIDHSVNQPINQSINQPITAHSQMPLDHNQHIAQNQPINQSITQTVIPGQNTVVKSLDSIPLHVKLDSHPINQPINQPVNQQPINQQPINQQPINQQPINESINQPINQSVNQPGVVINNAAIAHSQSVNHNRRTIETQTEQIDENDRSVKVLTPSHHALNQSVNQPINQSVSQPINQSTNQSVHPTSTQTPEKVVFHADPVQKPVGHSIDQPINQPTSPLSPMTPQSINQSANRATAQLNTQLSKQINQSINQSSSVWTDLIKWAAPLLPHGAIANQSINQPIKSTNQSLDHSVSDPATQAQIAAIVLAISQSEEFKTRLAAKQLERKIRRKAAIEEQKRLAALGINQPINQSIDPSTAQANLIGHDNSPIKLAIPYEIAASLLQFDQNLSQMRLKWVPSRVNEDTFFFCYFDEVLTGVFQFFDTKIKNSTGKQGLTVAQQVAALEAAKTH